ncbi:hypothetical protein NBC122_02811 [Chryseobacterium salivictor]|uniref:Uncharacterized protein n=1 Tax=Chryseobacterium salivictor TaxID=2547600 RepID=A0A4P6ZJ09_9FLAO|nr:hypothetical protein NBC122_02811 [Chryseobacterium salivictor]
MCMTKSYKATQIRVYLYDYGDTLLLNQIYKKYLHFLRV